MGYRDTAFRVGNITGSAVFEQAGDTGLLLRALPDVNDVAFPTTGFALITRPGCSPTIGLLKSVDNEDAREGLRVAVSIKPDTTFFIDGFPFPLGAWYRHEGFHGVLQGIRCSIPRLRVSRGVDVLYGPSAQPALCCPQSVRGGRIVDIRHEYGFVTATVCHRAMRGVRCDRHPSAIAMAS